MTDIIGRAVIKVIGELDPSSTSKIGKGFQAALVPAVGALSGLALGAKGAIDAASDLNEAASASKVIFGSASKSIDVYASSTKDAFSKRQALEATSDFGILAQSAGLSGKAAADFAKQFTTLAGDLASFKNTSPEEAMTAIGAALRGEAEPIRKYGVLLDDATLRQQALKMGLIDSVKQGLTPQQKALAASQVVLAQTKKAQGDFARTSESASNQNKKLAADSEDLSAKLGQELLPTYVSLQKAALGFLKTMNANPGATKAAIAGIAGLSAAVITVNAGMKVFGAGSAVVSGAAKVVGAAGRMRDGFRDAQAAQSAFSGVAGTLGGKLKIAVSAMQSLAVASARGAVAAGQFAVAQARAGVAAVVAAAKFVIVKTAQLAVAAAAKAWAVAQAALNAVLALNPITLIVVALAALGAGLVVAYQKSETFRDIVNAVFHAVADTAKTAFEFIKTIVTAVWDFITGYIQLQINIWTGIFDAFKTVVTAVWNGIKTAATTAWNGIKTVITGALDGIKTTATGVKNFLEGMWDGIKNKGVAAFNTLKAAVNAVIRGVNTAIDLVNRIPGIPNIPSIPTLYTGARNFPGGTALVGERGPELVNLPKGSDVYTAAETRAIAGRGNVKIVVNNYGPTTGSMIRRQVDWADKYGTRFGAATAAGGI